MRIIGIVEQDYWKPSPCRSPYRMRNLSIDHALYILYYEMGTNYIENRSSLADRIILYGHVPAQLGPPSRRSNPPPAPWET